MTRALQNGLFRATLHYMTVLPRDKTIAATRATAFEVDLLKAVEERVGSTAAAVRLAVLYVAYQKLGSMGVAEIRHKHGITFDDMRALFNGEDVPAT